MTKSWNFLNNWVDLNCLENFTIFSSFNTIILASLNMKFHQNISTRCKNISISVFCEYVYKAKLSILGLNVNNFATSKDIVMKLRIQRALYYGSE